jgi:hypothetical protein
MLKSLKRMKSTVQHSIVIVVIWIVNKHLLQKIVFVKVGKYSNVYYYINTVIYINVIGAWGGVVVKALRY